MTPGLRRRRCRFALAAIALAAAGCGPGPGAGAAGAQDPAFRRRPSRRRAARSEAGVRWQTLTPAQRQALAPLEREWPGIDAPRKQKWLQIAERYPTLPPAGARPDHRAHERMGPAHARRARRAAPALPGGAAGAGAGPLGEVGGVPEPAARREAAARGARRRLGRSGERRTPSADRRPCRASRDGSQAKANVVPNPALAQRPKPVAPTVVQATPGATTRLITQPVTPPAHQQSGMPKIAATPEFVNRSTLLPKRGPQAAAVRVRRPRRRTPPPLRPAPPPACQAGRADADAMTPERGADGAAGRGRRPHPGAAAAHGLLRLRGDAAVRRRPDPGGPGHAVLRPDRAAPSAAERDASLRAFALVVYGIYFVGCWSVRGQTLAMQTWRIRVVAAPTARGSARRGRWPATSPAASPGSRRRPLVAAALRLGPWPTLVAVVLGSSSTPCSPWPPRSGSSGTTRLRHAAGRHPWRAGAGPAASSVRLGRP